MKLFRLLVVGLLLGASTGLEAYGQTVPGPVTQPGIRRRAQVMRPYMRKHRRRHRHRRMIQTPFGPVNPGTARRVF